MKTDTRIYKLMARIPIYGIKGATHHATSCAVFDLTPGPCDCGAQPVQLVTMDEMRKALERFQQELAFNMPDPRKYETRGNLVHAVNQHVVGDSELEVRYVE